MDVSIGAVTYHHFNNRPAQEHFEKCVGNCQTILNPLVNLGFARHNVFAGTNSIARPMTGYRYNLPINTIASFTVGSYYQNLGQFNDKGITIPYTMGDFVPLAGIDMNYKMAGALISVPLSVFYIKF